MTPTADPHTSLSFEGTPPPELLRRRPAEQIFVTDLRLDETAFTASARLPLAHALYGDTSTPHHDIVLIADVISQVGISATVNLLSAPVDWEFMVRRFEVVLDPLESNERGRDQAQMTVTTDGGDAGLKVRGTASAGGTGFITTRNSVEGRPSGTSHVSTFWVPEEKYRELRQRVRKHLDPVEPAPVSFEPEALTGREDLDNVVISTLQPAAEGGYESCLRVDLDHPTFFGRPLDHVNGFLLFEAVRQAAIAAACRDLDASPSEVVVSVADVSYVAFAELDALTRCKVSLSEEGAAAVELSQSGRAVTRANLTVKRL